MSNTMRAAMQYAIDDIRLEDVPVPEIGPGELLLKTRACGLCGGETMAWYKTEPKVLGHEPSGEAVEVGAGVTDDKVGDRLIVNHHVGRVNSHLSRRGAAISPVIHSTRPCGSIPAGSAIISA